MGRRIAILVLIGCLLPVAGARAATLSDAFGVVFDGATGSETNTVAISIGNHDGRVHVNDSAASITPSGNCTAEAGIHFAGCPIPDAPFMLVRLDGGNDSLLADVLVTVVADGG